MVADSNGQFYDMFPVDVEQGTAPNSFVDGLNTTGRPTQYDKLGNGIFLDPIPNYSRTAGIKVYVSREGSYFTSSDTTKKPGFAGLFHEYLALRPSFMYAKRKGMATANNFEEQMLRMESDIQEYYRSREKDVQRFIRPVFRSSR